LRENIWYIFPAEGTAQLLTPEADFEVGADEALEFLRMRSYCTGHASLEDIARRSGVPLAKVEEVLASLEDVQIVFGGDERAPMLPWARNHEILSAACLLWRDELRFTRIENRLLGEGLAREILVGWLVERYHHARDFTAMFETAAVGAGGELSDFLASMAEQLRGHEEYFVQALENLGLTRAEVQTSNPLLSTRLIAFLMTELVEIEPWSALMIAALLEPGEPTSVDHERTLLRAHYGLDPGVFAPLHEQRRAAIEIGYGQLLAQTPQLGPVVPTPSLLDTLVNKVHELRHAFDFQGQELESYFGRLEGKYLPKQPLDFPSMAPIGAVQDEGSAPAAPASAKGKAIKRVVLVAFDDFTDVDLVCMWDLFKRVRRSDFSVRIVGDAPRHRSMTGLSLPVHGALEEANDAHAVIFASGKGNRRKIADPEYLARFRLDPSTQLIGSICSGALFLGALGLLEGKRATTYPTARHALEKYGVKVVEQPFVREGNVATAGGCIAAQYLVGWVLEELLGPEVRDFVVTSCQPVGEGLRFDSEVVVVPGS